MLPQTLTKKQWLLIAVFLVLLPLPLQFMGNFWVRIVDMALLYILLAIGLNIVVGYTGLLDLGYVAFFAVGAYIFALLNSPHLLTVFEGLKDIFPNGLHTSIFIVVPIAIVVAGVVGICLGAPTLKLRGDYLAIMTLGFGEIIRVFLKNLDHPLNITNGPKGLGTINSVEIFGIDFANNIEFESLGFTLSSLTLYYWLFLSIVVISIVISHRLENSRIGRGWMAIREDEVAAQAMGLNTRNFKLLAFGLGAIFGGVSGTLFAAFQGFISPESFVLMESIMIVAMVVLGGIGHLPGVVLGAFLLAMLPEVLRWVSGFIDLRSYTAGRLDPSILRQLLIAMVMIAIMLWRPHGLWPRKARKTAPAEDAAAARSASASGSTP